MHSYVHVVEKSALVVTANISYALIAYIFRVELHYKSNFQFMHVFQIIYFSFLSVFISSSIWISTSFISFMHAECPLRPLLPIFSDHSHNILHIQALNNMEYQVVFFYSDFHVPCNTNKTKRLLRDVEFKDFLSPLGCFIFWNIDVVVLQNRWLKTLLIRHFATCKNINLAL